MSNATIFPPDFLWGVASSAYQVEGAVNEDGRRPSVWDMFELRSGAVRHDHRGTIACDHYHRYPEDADLIAALGVSAYRLSVAWPRVIPDADGRVCSAGLDFYDRLVDALLERGVHPWVTLFHWDMPYEAFCRGGWLNRDVASWFSDYVSAIVGRLGDRVEHWITLNEPQCFIGLGHYTGMHAPGLRYGKAEVLRATHHALLTHGHAVQAIRAAAPGPVKIGWSPVGWVAYPSSHGERDIEAARQAMFSVKDSPIMWPFNNAWYSDPVVLGRYPVDPFELFGAAAPPIEADDLKTINQPLDFYGVNIYHGIPVALEVSADGSGAPVTVDRPLGHPETLMSWTVDPSALYWGPRFLYERYQLPIYITENGLASMDWVHADGKIHDAGRIDYMNRYLRALRRACEHGVDIRGYFHWSILDNFEWELGYSKRFGLVYVDYESQRRIPKDSYHWYRRIVQSNGECLPDAVVDLDHGTP